MLLKQVYLEGLLCLAYGIAATLLIKHEETLFISISVGLKNLADWQRQLTNV